MSRFTAALLGLALLGCLTGNAHASEASQVDELIALARLTPDYAQRDQILASGVRKFREAQSYITVAAACVYSPTKANVLRGGGQMAQNVNEAVAVARACADYAVRDEILLGDLRLCHQVADYLTLFSAAVYTPTKTSILRASQRDCRYASDFVTVARQSADYAVRDEILLVGAQRVSGVPEFLQLFGAAVYTNTKTTLLRAAVRDARSINQFVQIAVLSSDYAVRDEILLKAVPYCQSVADVSTLTGQAVYSTTKAEIVRQYNQMRNFAALHAQ
jgi:hypothetical protein